MWFLWLLLVGDFGASGLHQLAPRLGDPYPAYRLPPRLDWPDILPVFLIASALAYVPMALVFTPSAWFDQGPFAFQLSRPVHYAVY